MSARPPMLSFLMAHYDRVPRPSRGRVMVRCNFPDHPDRTPSVCWNLDTGKFRCYGCGRYGDVIDYLMVRYGWDFKHAARTIGMWRDEMTPAESRELRQLRANQERRHSEEIARKEQERRERIAARDLLHTLERLYLQAQDDHDIDSMADLLPRIRQAEADYWDLAGLGEHVL